MFPGADYVREPPAPILLNVLRGGAPVAALLGIHPLADGSMLVVGRDTHDLKEIKKLIGNAIIAATRSEEHTSELQSLMRISYAVFCLKKKITPITLNNNKYNK